MHNVLYLVYQEHRSTSAGQKPGRDQISSPRTQQRSVQATLHVPVICSQEGMCIRWYPHIHRVTGAEMNTNVRKRLRIPEVARGDRTTSRGASHSAILVGGPL
ncbi:hypothetical protein PILCRDRAFT_392975 [Piloderma croceum F 1598]|uniref:Uncharacterized protein n=1 Tax=Piloderma croceum (strain F 1598) TaxID=765440 RepID=A0A0C3BEF6_PILCF|nr:hypothetical protein PILCRDRAFT_392975 [Piloderma croceum F 1598]